MFPIQDDTITVVDTRPSRADALKNRRVLLETAAQLFAEFGVEAVTMSAVAQAAGVGKGTLYRHFTNKTELCHALLDQEQRDLQENTLLRLRDAAYTPMENLHWFVEQVVTFVTRNLAMLNVFDDQRSLNHPAHQWWWQTIRALLGRMDANGDLDYATDTLYVMLDPRVLHFQTITRGYDLTRVMAGLHSLIDHFIA